MGINIQKTEEYTGHRGSIFSLFVDEVNQQFFTSGDDGIVVKWKLTDGGNEGEGIIQVGRAVYSLCLIPHLSHLWIGTSSGILHVVDVTSRKSIHQDHHIPAPIYQIHYDPSFNRVWILYGSGYMRVLVADSFQEIRQLRLSDQHLRSICLIPNQELIYIGASDHHIYVLEQEQIHPVHKWKAHENSVFSLNVHKEGKYLISGGRDAHLNSWDLNQQHQLIKSIPAHNFTINDIEITWDGSYFATASRDKTIKIWDAYNLTLLKVINFEKNQGHKHSVNKLKWLRSDNCLISCSDDRRIIKWKVFFD